MDNNIYHVHQLSSPAPVVHLTRSNGAEPIIKALRERRDSDARSISTNQSMASTSSSQAGLYTSFAMITGLVTEYGRVLTTMADVR